MKKKVMIASLAPIAFAAPLLAEEEGEARVGLSIVDPNDLPPVNLTSVAELEYTPAEGAHDAWKSFEGTWRTDFALTVDADGVPVRCQPFRRDLDREIATTLCFDLLDHAKVRLLQGFSTGGRNAIIGISKEPFRQLAIAENTSPFVFRLAELGPSDYIAYDPIKPSEAPLVSQDQAMLIDQPKKRKYPIYASRNRYSGTVRVLNEIAPDGSIASCRPVASSGYAILDNAACAHMLKHARYRLTGATEDLGRPVFQTVNFVWELPDGPKSRNDRRGLF